MTRLFIFAGLFLTAVSLSWASDNQEDRPDWGYTWIDAHYLPDNASDELKEFWNAFVPMMEARTHAESAYIREYAADLYKLAKQVPGTLDTDNGYNKKYYNRSAHQIVKHAARLKDVVYGSPSSVLYEEMKAIEDNYIRLCNFCD
jgi:hypothetical protein